MNDEFIPWDQYALLAYIAKFGDQNKLGKTAFQKLVFLFSQISDIAILYIPMARIQPTWHPI
jgi:hypothetical protein